jgi:adenosylhomocysteine nucleosidase
MRVLITFAVEAEFAPWRRRHNFSDVSADDLRTFHAIVSGVEATVLLTGIGNDRAGSAMLGLQMNSFVAGRGFDICVSSGLGGSLRAQYHAGDIVAAKQVCTKSIHLDLGKDTISCDAELVAAAEVFGAKPVPSFYTADHIVIKSAEKASLSILADVVEMESFNIMKEAYAWGTRGIAVRAVSDTSAEDLPIDLNLAVTDKGGMSLARMAGQVMRSPGSVPSLLKFGRQSHLAAKALADFLDVYIPALASKGQHIVSREVPAS